MLARGSAGPFEYVVIRSEDGATLRTWLTTNGYFVSPEAAAHRRRIRRWAVLVRRAAAAGRPGHVGHPPDRPARWRPTEACLPLKLTAIAATPDLRINVWVLGDARAVPINYSEIAINQARLDWFNFGRNYDQLLKDAANEAQGNAFASNTRCPRPPSSAWFTVSSTARADAVVRR